MATGETERRPGGGRRAREDAPAKRQSAKRARAEEHACRHSCERDDRADPRTEQQDGADVDDGGEAERLVFDRLTRALVVRLLEQLDEDRRREEERERR